MKRALAIDGLVGDLAFLAPIVYYCAAAATAPPAQPETR